MAKIESVQLVDDLDGGPADETVLFGIDGKQLVVDLSSANADKLRGLLSEYVAVARRVTGGRQSRRATSTTDRGENQAIRSWLRDNGVKVAERGRIPEQFRYAYQQGRPELAKG